MFFKVSIRVFLFLFCFNMSWYVWKTILIIGADVSRSIWMGSLQQMIHVSNDHCLKLKLDSLCHISNSSAWFNQFLCLSNEKLYFLVFLIFKIKRNDEHLLSGLRDLNQVILFAILMYLFIHNFSFRVHFMIPSS